VVVACWTLSNNQLILFMDNCFATLMHSCKYFSMERLLTCKRIQVYKFSYTKLTFSHQSFAKQNTLRYDKLNWCLVFHYLATMMQAVVIFTSDIILNLLKAVSIWWKSECKGKAHYRKKNMKYKYISNHSITEKNINM
jgi:hypothetical protein